MKKFLMAMAKKIIALEEARLKSGKYEGAEATRVQEILDLAKKSINDTDE